ncbi:MAG: VOC family protein [Treponema sp.]|jgi:catechol 2,3-dioxygenase-like lactoylglutathione lyase family enzyme|nr:VOC family protein [Treponema sp.]
MLSFLAGDKPFQAGFLVQDLEACIRSYIDRFGVGGWQVYTYGPEILSRMIYRGKNTSYSSRIGLNYICGTRIELIQPLEGQTIFTEFIEKHGYGQHHLGIYVDNIRTAIEEAEEAGFKVIMEGGGHGLDGDGFYAYLDTEETLGTTYELIERPARRRKPEAVLP